jgi:hypothetical protein
MVDRQIGRRVLPWRPCEDDRQPRVTSISSSTTSSTASSATDISNFSVLVQVPGFRLRALQT